MCFVSTCLSLWCCTRLRCFFAPERLEKHREPSSSLSTFSFASSSSLPLSRSPHSPSLSPPAVFVFSRPACLSNSKYPCYLTQIHLSTWPRTQRRAAVCACVSEKVYSPVTLCPLVNGDWVNTHKHTHTPTHMHAPPPGSPLLWDKTQV